MNYKDFRYGNLVEFEGEVYEIDTISAEFPTLNTNKFGIGVVTWENIKPIELAEEWLLKFGFKEVEGNQWYRFFDLEYFRVFVGKNQFIYWKGNQIDNMISDTLYIHNIQNLFHSLTNKELSL